MSNAVGITQDLSDLVLINRISGHLKVTSLNQNTGGLKATSL